MVDGVLSRRGSQIPLAERQVQALERLASAEEERNRQIRADSVERREARAASEARSDERMIKLAGIADADDIRSHVHDEDPQRCPPGCDRRIGAEAFLELLRRHPSRRAKIVTWETRSGQEHIDVTVRIEERAYLSLRAFDEVEVIFLALPR